VTSLNPRTKIHEIGAGGLMLYIPSVVRDRWEIKKGDLVELSLDDDVLSIRKVE